MGKKIIIVYGTAEKEISTTAEETAVKLLKYILNKPQFVQKNEST